MNRLCLPPRSFRGPVRAQSGGIGFGGESSLGKLIARAHHRVPALAQRTRLEMGHYANASRAPRKMNPGSLRPFQQARAKLQLLDKNEATK